MLEPRNTEEKVRYLGTVRYLVSGAKRKIPRQIRGQTGFGLWFSRTFFYPTDSNFFLDMYVCYMTSIRHEA